VKLRETTLYLSLTYFSIKNLFLKNWKWLGKSQTKL